MAVQGRAKIERIGQVMAVQGRPRTYSAGQIAAHNMAEQYLQLLLNTFTPQIQVVNSDE